MQRHSGVEVGLCRLHLHGDGDDLSEFGRFRPDDMATEDSFDHFWEAHVGAWHRHLAGMGIRPIEGGSIPAAITRDPS